MKHKACTFKQKIVKKKQSYRAKHWSVRRADIVVSKFYSREGKNLHEEKLNFRISSKKLMEHFLTLISFK